MEGDLTWGGEYKKMITQWAKDLNKQFSKKDIQ